MIILMHADFECNLCCNRTFDGLVTSFVSKQQTKMKFTGLLTEKLKKLSLSVSWGLSSTGLATQVFALQRDSQVVTCEMKQVNLLVHSTSDKSIFQSWIMALKSKQ